ncbi:hypothetical protein K503DRAFT_786744 [Rhizopogon vinicolor AM-OR11-026]|uniref:Uncharacterized protein n=1 Tax=Rhizopogon vinicolor AM-OR11-026 TaxID=1314800 RepID=A0A1B7MKI5_9AGAM|nr:hypothetical protein K503DRAFT_786744 [Rhizopogon vinicolor AM-OR11-026]
MREWYQYALADTAIVVRGDITWCKSSDSVSNMREVWDILREGTVGGMILSREFKSLVAGSKEVMESVLRMVRSHTFRWDFYGGSTRHETRSPDMGRDTPFGLADPAATHEMLATSLDPDSSEKNTQMIIQQAQIPIWPISDTVRRYKGGSTGGGGNNLNACGAGPGMGEGASSGPTSSGSGIQAWQSGHTRTGTIAPVGLEDAICIDTAIKGSSRVFVRLEYGVYDSTHFEHRHRSIHLCHTQSSLSIVLTSEISRDKCQWMVVHGETVINGVPTPTPNVYGLFQESDPDGATAIFIEYAGTRIDQVPGRLSREQQHIHRRGVLHNEIAERNLLIRDAGQPIIVDFGNATVVDWNNRESFDSEMVQLRDVLSQFAREKSRHS